jgi:hypothetical protein
MRKFLLFTVILFQIFTVASLNAKSIVSLRGEGPNLRPRITQAQVVRWPLEKILKNGVRIFSTPFNFHDGFGDGQFYDTNHVDPLDEGVRPTLQKNGTFLRVNGLDGQTCAECHFIKSNLTIPFTFGLGGTAGGGANVLFKPTVINTEHDEDNYNGRFINSPILFGAGGIELVAKEMTQELQGLKQEAIDKPETAVGLFTKGVYFGTIIADEGGNIDYSLVEGIDNDLVVRPFGRKGVFITTREFDEGAFRFHFGMETVEDVGLNIDNDEDGVVNEITVGEMSALHIWVATRPRPRALMFTKRAIRGFKIFKKIGCAECHIPTLQTNSRKLTFSLPVNIDPTQKVFHEVDLVETAGFKPNKLGGIEVPLFADLKRHDMGPDLAESFHDPRSVAFNAQFTTARLWGVADSAPYLHDGRALTITEAILMLGGEAQDARDEFAELSHAKKNAVLAFLYTLRAPK